MVSKRSNRRAQVTTGIAQEWVENFLLENNYLTSQELPPNVSSFFNDMAISLMLLLLALTVIPGR